MRIAVFIKSTTFHKGYGGLETQNKLLCEGLVRRGHAITVFSPKKEVDIETASQNGVDYVFVKSNYRTLFSSFDKNNWYQRSYETFTNMSKTTPFDLVVSQSSAGLGIISRRVHGYPKVVSIAHGSIISELKTVMVNGAGLVHLAKDTLFSLYNFFWRQRTFVHGSDRVVAVSSYVKKALVEETYVIEDKIRVIHNGIDPTALLTLNKGTHTGGNAFLYVGQITKSKGIDTLIRVFEDPELKDTQLQVVGGGDMLDVVKSTQNVTFQGKISYDLLPKAYTDKSGFLFPTKRYEGFPMVLVEAMFAGLPIVAFDMGGVSDAVIDGITGYLLRPEDISGFKRRVIELSQNPELAAKLGASAREKAMAEYTVDAMINGYEHVFEEVLNK